MNRRALCSSFSQVVMALMILSACIAGISPSGGAGQSKSFFFFPAKIYLGTRAYYCSTRVFTETLMAIRLILIIGSFSV